MAPRQEKRKRIVVVNRTRRGVQKYTSVPGLNTTNEILDQSEDSSLFPESEEDGSVEDISEDEPDHAMYVNGERRDQYELTYGGAVPLMWQVKIDGADQFFLNPDMKENAAEFLRRWLCDQSLFNDRGKIPTLQNPSIGCILAKWLIDTERAKQGHRRGTQKRSSVKKPRRILKKSIGNLGNYKNGSSFSEVKTPLRDAILSGKSRDIYE